MSKKSQIALFTHVVSEWAKTVEDLMFDAEQHEYQAAKCRALLADPRTPAHFRMVAESELPERENATAKAREVLRIAEERLRANQQQLREAQEATPKTAD